MKVKDLINEVQTIRNDEILMEAEDSISKFIELIKDNALATKVKEFLSNMTSKKEFIKNYTRILSKKMADNKINLSGKQDVVGAKSAEEENDKRGAFVGALAYAGINVDIPRVSVPA